MPLSYVIDKHRGRVTSTASGVLTYADVAAHQEGLKRDPDFNPTFDQLFDGTAVTKIELTAGEIQTIARQRLFAAGSRQAFAAGSEFAYGMARMFEIYRETSGAGRLVRVFNGLEAAREWLEPIRVRKKA